MAERSATLGKVVVRGLDVELHVEENAEIEVDRGDHILLSVLYEFVDTEADRETMNLRLDVSLNGARAGSAETTVDDKPVLNDSHQGALTLRARAPGADAEGVFHVRVQQDAGVWGDKTNADREVRAATGSFRVRVR